MLSLAGLYKVIKFATSKLAKAKSITSIDNKLVVNAVEKLGARAGCGLSIS